MAPLYFEETVLLATLAKTFGESAARAAVEKLDLEGKTYPLKVSVPLHEKLQTVVSNPEHVSFVQEVVNDALAIPLQALGYRLAEVDFHCAEGALNLDLQLGLQRLVPVVVLENKMDVGTPAVQVPTSVAPVQSAENKDSAIK